MVTARCCPVAAFVAASSTIDTYIRRGTDNYDTMVGTKLTGPAVGPHPNNRYDVNGYEHKTAG